MLKILQYILKNRFLCDMIDMQKKEKRVENFSHLEKKLFYPSRQKAGEIMCKAAEVGKIVVNKCLSKHILINTQKLQKLLVLMQVECIRRSAKPLFKEDIRIWDCGVAIKEVDDEFYNFAEGFVYSLEEFITLLEAEEESVNYVLDNYGSMDAFELNDLPDNQRVKALGVIQETTCVPHVSYQILIGAFSDDTDRFCP